MQYYQYEFFKKAGCFSPLLLIIKNNSNEIGIRYILGVSFLDIIYDFADFFLIYIDAFVDNLHSCFYVYIFAEFKQMNLKDFCIGCW